MGASQAFWKWIRLRLNNIKGIVFLLVTTSSTIFNLYVALRSEGWSVYHTPILYGTQALIILIMSAIIAFGSKPKEFEKYKRGTRALRQFWSWWPRLWFAWFLLYVGLTFWTIYLIKNQISGVQPISADLNSAIQICLHQLNNVATLILLMLYHLLAEPSLSEEEYPAEGDIFRQNQRAIDKPANWQEQMADEQGRFMFWVSAFIALGIAEVGLVFVAGDKTAESVLLIFGVAYGILAATATALLVGQLTNRLLGVPTPVLVILFIYAGIQPSFDFILHNENEFVRVVAKEVIVVAALACKVILFSTIYWLGMTDRLLYFLVENYSLYKGVDEHRRGFLQKIRPGGGGVVIPMGEQEPKSGAPS